MAYRSALTSFTAAFVDELAEQGIRQVVISPGSRSTPLAMLIHAHPLLKTWIDVDERSAAFFALGMAKKSNQPVAIVCSSGTATANFYPAVIEAKYGRVPLVVLTADRPHELRGNGSPQTIDQIKMYGDHVKWFQDMPLPEDNEAMWRFARYSARRAVDTAEKVPKGPTHLNFPFREPLVPDFQKTGLWAYGKKATSKNESTFLALEDAAYAQLATEWQSIRRPLIIIGPNRQEGLRASAYELAEHLGAPILADPLSGVRFGSKGKQALLIDSYDALLRNSAFIDKYQADGIIRFGANPVSKSLTKYLKQLDPSSFLIIDEGFDWLDATHPATQILHTDPVVFCRRFSRLVSEQNNAVAGTWREDWQQANSIARDGLERYLSTAPWFEGHIAASLYKHLPPEATLFASNSMPIRDIDTFFLAREDGLDIIANRGANGIDGVVSSALGCSALVHQTAYLLIGDLAFFHDMNGLMMAKNYGLDMIIVVINNNGGGIFSFLPQASEAGEQFEDLFGTPLNYEIEAVANLYGAHYFKAVHREAFDEALKNAQGLKGLRIIEAVTNRQENVLRHNKLWQDIHNGLTAEGEGHED
ncbi:2-succinyl-5-enolpyruvyl-6-hydroxy-3-cyclohexene-1-carboxylate synthase [Pullulanibacillus camelliae]|uniref:2-succinyl-5-enolpyruvyl-6-hydroxy-3-cyclohexene-1-carboxylate synthase n=1 Tax=Pullulanibacillus camelliae TaxID=1707096 RepID=A0A8J3DYJ6_9BACL|nr:2-succinyl-5-enolpyruvyl-6-hydroxy-3-cyclohexene-1-carboxylic-acid synthase [Pullulanibacillus camelliae]GGE49985.1 2-succinyl-5-enolpyruvyl-6-hydroxy-3-cyclohexene-1-carboxylate synthase [Pullulanibacillus camelliae]